MAFVQGTLDEEIYMKITEGLNEYYQENLEGIVLKLNKALDGLKQSGRVCYQMLENGLVEMDFRQSSFDSCAYIKVDQNKDIVIVTIYIDDLLIFSNSVKLKNWVKEQLKSTFKMKDLGTASYCLGIKIERDRKNGSVSLNQTQYVEGVLRRYNMHESHPITTPLDTNKSITKSIANMEDLTRFPYQTSVGSLLYAAQATRPDIGYAVNLLCQFCSNPSGTHWTAVKRIMRYLRGTAETTLNYSRNNGDAVIDYCDSNYGGDIADRRSTTRYVFTIGGGAVLWFSKRQPTVATSTTEAEYMALSAAAKEAIWLNKIVTDIGLSHIKTIPVHCDNNGVINLSKNNMYHARSKHIDIQHHFVREVIKNGHNTAKSMPTASMIADFLTKSVQRS
ncbi:Retrovirus-related Pol polyprotein from transposon TNT 1-94 [Araneus ventricosus]|uniref:Retrovirus-related Pol polyprotein from transposon TNT 1-94 n=1 Tax=Araneus ventricosus TaxID=182803 RepID=A0A4Y2BGI8_ARAVE|nr:Retrovirus-related Pol polyprotein from transposon TNT 1-94 [Araneus ventricosus]